MSLSNLDFQNKKRLCDQVLLEIRSQILSGQLSPGERLPTVRMLAAQLGINFNTVARAYRILDQEGWITTRQGRGTFVVGKDDPAHANLQQIQDEAVHQIVNLILAEAQKLDMPVEEIFSRVDRRLRGKGLFNKNAKAKHHLLQTRKSILSLKGGNRPVNKNRQRHLVKRTSIKRPKG